MPRTRRLMSYVQNVSILISTVVIALALATLRAVDTFEMTGDLQRKAVVTAEETASLLAEPLYIEDDPQAVRIGKALISSGRISGITLDSAASGRLLYERIGSERSRIAPQERNISLNGIFLGTVRIAFSDAELVSTSRRLDLAMALAILASIGTNLIANRFVLQRRILGTLGPILEGIGSVAEGKYDLSLPPTGFSDADTLFGLVNDMAAKVQAKNAELLSLNEVLEQKVAERTAELENSLTELRLAQDRLIESGRLSALGHLSAGIAHELNTPLGAILSSERTLSEFLGRGQRDLIEFVTALDTRQLKLFDEVLALGAQGAADLAVSFPDRAARLEARSRLASAGIADSEDLADSLLDLGIAAGLDGLIEPLREPMGPEIVSCACQCLAARRMGKIIEISARKAANVVAALRSYMSTDSRDMEQVVDVRVEIENILLIMQNMLKKRISVRRELSEASVVGSADQLGQVWINLIRNAAQAMDYSGELVVGCESRDGKVLVRIVDSGPGIPEEIQGRIFSPFFTTKKEGEGMGLGLDLCRRIVESHHGTIALESRPGRTEFLVTLPASGAGG
jgi:signal transduction histidine kinase